MSDVRLYHTADGGEIDLVPDGTYTEIILDTGLETAAYLSLFGGNERDPGTLFAPAVRDLDHAHLQQWWGNIGETSPRTMRSETANMLLALPAISSNLGRLEQAAIRDLEWFKSEGVAQEVDVTAMLTGVDRITIQVRIQVAKEEFVFAFFAMWGN